MTGIRAVTAVWQLVGACFHGEIPSFIPSHVPCLAVLIEKPKHSAQIDIPLTLLFKG